MKIIYLIQSLHNSGGMERVITLKANLLSETYGYDIEIITYSENSNCYFDLSNKVKVTNFPATTSATSRKKNFIKIVDYINFSDAAVVISTGGKDITIAGKINKKIQKILEVHFCFKNPIIREKSLKRNWVFHLLGYIKIIRNLYYSRKFDTIVALTNRDADLWRKYSGVGSIAIANPSPFVVDPTSIKSNKSNKTRFVAIGRLDAQKNFESLLNACSILKNQLNCEDWTLDIYGEGELENPLNSQLKKLQLYSNVAINGPVSNIEKIYKAADFLLMTSMYEGLPMVLIESMSFGVPCVSFDCESGPAEIINHAHNGYLIKDRCNFKFAAAMKNCIEMSNIKYHDFSKNAYDTSSDYQPEVILEHWENLFKKTSL